MSWFPSLDSIKSGLDKRIIVNQIFCIQSQNFDHNGLCRVRLSPWRIIKGVAKNRIHESNTESNKMYFFPNSKTHLLH